MLQVPGVVTDGYRKCVQGSAALSVHRPTVARQQKGTTTATEAAKIATAAAAGLEHLQHLCFTSEREVR